MNLKSKVAGFFLLLGLFYGSLVIGLTWKSVRSIVTKNLAETGLAEVSNLAETMANGFQAQSETLLLPALETAQKAINAGYVAALDTEGRVLAHTNVAEKNMVYDDPLTQQMLREAHPGTRVTYRDKEPVMEVWAPVWMKQNEESNEQFLLGGQTASPSTRRIGTVRLSLPMRETLRTQTQIIRNMSLIVGLIGLIAFLFTLGLMRKILTPIRLLAKGAAYIDQEQD